MIANAMPTIDTLWAFAGQFGITLVVAVGAAWALFRYLGDKWISNKFTASLESFRHAQAQEIEKLRLKINTAFDRTVKLHNQEFEVLPELWDRLIEAYSYTVSFVSPFQSYPDLDRLSLAELNHFLDQSKLHNYQRNDILASSTRTESYMEMIFWHNYNDVANKREHFDRYSRSKGLFVQEDLQGEINKLADLMFDALNEARYEKQHPNLREGRFAKSEKLRTEGPPLYDAIGKTIKAKLWERASL